MTISVERYRALKAKVDKAQRDHDHAEGALSVSLQKLQEEFGCSTIKQAEAKAKKLRAEADRVEEEYEEALEDFESKWSEVLDRGEGQSQ